MGLTPPSQAVEHDPPSERDPLISRARQDRDVNGDALRQDPDVPTIPGVNLRVVITALAAGIILSAADNTIVMASYGRIGTDFNELNRTSWISTAYLLTIASFQPLYGRLSNIYGRKSCLIFAYTVFGIGAFFCGISQNMDQLIAARAFAGIGGGGIHTVGVILVSDIVPLRSRGTWQGVLNIIFGLGVCAGGPIGGLLSDTVGWRWAFLGQAPITIVAILMVTFTLHIPKTPGTNTEVASKRAKLQRVDFAGAFTLVFAVSCLLISLDLSVNTINYDFTSPLTQSLLIASVLLFFAFYHVENSYSAEPFCPPAMVKRPEILAPCLANFFAFATLNPVIFHIPLFYQAVLGSSAAVAGQSLIPMILGGVMGSVCGGIFIQKTGRYYWLIVVSHLALLLGVGIILTCIMLTGTGLPEGIVLGFMILGMVVTNAGFATSLTALLIALISNVTTEEQAVVTAVSYLFRSVGSVVSLSISAMCMQKGLKRRLLENLGNRDDVNEILMKAAKNLDFIAELKPDVRAIVRKAYQGGITDAVAFALAPAILGWLCTWATREVRVKK